MALGAIVGATALALIWVFLVPINQLPDEPVHFDHALALNKTRSLFRPAYVPPSWRGITSCTRTRSTWSR